VRFDPEGYGFVVNLINGTITFDGGYTAQIVETLDHHGNETDEQDKVRFVTVIVPPESLTIAIDLEQLDAGEVVTIVH
jgi:hypothetical protein